MSIVALRILFQQGKAARALIVCPSSVLDVWDRHLVEWAPALTTTVVRGNKQVREADWRYPAHVYLTTYDTLRSDVLGEEPLLHGDRLRCFDVAIMDEAQQMKNPESGRSRAGKAISPRFRWALTGTPLENRLDDLVSIFGFVKPGLLWVEGLSPREAQRLIKPHFLRRLKRDVLKDLPAKTKQEEWLSLDEAQERAYKQVLEAGRHDLEALGDKASRIHVFALLSKLKRICNFAPMRAESPKTEALFDHLEVIVDNGKKVIVFSQYLEEGVHKLASLLEQQGFGYEILTGEQSDGQKRRALEAFRREPDKGALIATIKTGGVGLTLTEASYVVHFDHWWNPAVMWQAEDRVHRPGQSEPVTIYSYWMKNTIDERIYQKLREKGLLFQEVVGGLSEEVIESAITIEEWYEILGVKARASREEPSATGARKMSIDEVLRCLSKLDPLVFEVVVRDLFVKLGFVNARTTKRSHDGGIDIEASRPGFGGPEYVVVQCKRVSSMGVEHARELLGVLAANPSLGKGYLVTSGQITQECRSFCRKDGRLSCIDGMLLAKYVREFDLRLG